MAEAHSAVAFSFKVTHEGVGIDYDRELIHELWHGIKRSYKRRLARFKNSFHARIYPATPATLLFCIFLCTGSELVRKDFSLGLVPFLHRHLPLVSEPGAVSLAVCSVLLSVLVWFLMIQLIRLSLKLLLSYKGWMYLRFRRQSKLAQLWMGFMKFLTSKRPMLNSFQGALPKLPVPSLHDTLQRHLLTVRPLMDDEKYARLAALSEEFEKNLGPKLQRYLMLYSWFTDNYVTYWWEEFVYLRSRAPIMVNSNYYGLDSLNMKCTTFQAARAANMTCALLEFRRMLDRQELKPLMVQGTVPLCSYQYERMFNSCRVPGLETDHLRHWLDAKHVVVYNGASGIWWKVQVHNGRRLMTPAELEWAFQQILDAKDELADSAAERHLGALTAWLRSEWHQVRKEHFRSGLNRISLDTIERAAFVVALDEAVYDYDPNDTDKLDSWACAMLHGQGYDRWFDKSFNLIVSKNGRVGVNAEHSWGDAPVCSHLFEYAMLTDAIKYQYAEDGHCLGSEESKPNGGPERLRWSISDSCAASIQRALKSAEKLIGEVEMRLLVFEEYGKGFIKKCKCSPDAYLQMALQLTYFRDQRKFPLTYEASMTRLYRCGRTETVRTVTQASCDFVRAMDDSKKTVSERKKLLADACDLHQLQYLDAMCGKGVDRHLFCLYVVSKWLERDSPFLSEILSEPWRLSTSQTPQQQTDLLNTNEHPDYVSAGGGFGPVADDGYGVSYIISGEQMVSFHISSKVTCETTNSRRFRERLRQSLRDMHALFA